MSPASLPVTPAQPDLPSYGIPALNLFQTWTRASYLAAFGIQAPPYDNTQPTRTWFDSSAQPGPYSVIQVSGTSATVGPLAVPKDVGLPNLPGAYQYVAWVNPATTVAQVQEPGFGPTPFNNAAALCSLADAEAVLTALPAGASISEESLDAQILWGTETRRQYVLTVPGGARFNAAYLRAMMTQQITDPQGNVLGGVGAPGSFTISGNAANWTLAPDPGLSAGPAMPVPCRALLSNERFEPGLLGAGGMIVRTDKQQAGNSGFSDAQASWVMQVLQAINLQWKLGLPQPPSV